MHTTLALCESPLQLINSISYLKTIGQIDNSLFFIRLNAISKNDNLIKDLVKKNKISARFFTIESKSKSKLLLTHLKVIKKIIFSPIKNIVIGDLRSKWMINRISPIVLKNITLIFVDDGLATISNYKKTEILQSKIKNKIIYFTSLKLKSNIIEIKSQIKEKKIIVPDDSMLFIGSPLIDKNITTESQYVDFLLKVVNENKKYSLLIYCLHRSENYLTHEKIKNLGFDFILDLDIDIESAIENGTITPKRVTGLYSTALVNIDNLFLGIDIIAYIPDENFYSKNNLKNILQVYSYFDNHTSINTKKI